MRAVVQKVLRAGVAVNGVEVGAIGPGILVFLGIASEDSNADVDYTVEKILNLRIFEDEAGQMNRSVLDVAGSLLVVSQFTLYGDARRGRRPSFIRAAKPHYESFVSACRLRIENVQTGVFQAMMEVSLVNDGPVTILLDSMKLF
jgi:D-aminoacyl-tRNA deacylase